MYLRPDCRTERFRGTEFTMWRKCTKDWKTSAHRGERIETGQ